MAVWKMVPLLKILVGVLNPNQRNCLCVKTLRIFVFQNPNIRSVKWSLVILSSLPCITGA
ncbi:hypothetical protein BRARA_F02044 [Brassica rapa]|uniref:Uncharacterized protein n=2 Tax=Brassica campestris TaxID=3711 RepID=A0A397Z3R2_BRACM|nr:hypothetical protein BRARA_F02044 [Brassica rapa]